MTWIKIETDKKTSKVSFVLSVRKSGFGIFIITVASAIAAQLGFEKAERAELFMGSDENAGKLMVKPAANGLKISRMKYAYAIRLPVMAGITLRNNQASLDYERQADGGFVIQLPDWALPGGRNKLNQPEVPEEGDRPGSLEMNGTVLIMGARSLTLSKSEAIIMKELVDNWGKCVSRQQIMDAVYAFDPNGGAGEKIVDVWILKLRDKLAEKKFELMIVTHRGLGWELRRPVA